jgi:hypothetical protein
MVTMSCEQCDAVFTDGIDAGNHEMDAGHRVGWDAPKLGVGPAAETCGHCDSPLVEPNATCDACGGRQEP